MTVDEMRALVDIIDAMEKWICCSSPDYKKREQERVKILGEVNSGKQ